MYMYVLFRKAVDLLEWGLLLCHLKGYGIVTKMNESLKNHNTLNEVGVNNNTTAWFDSKDG